MQFLNVGIIAFWFSKKCWADIGLSVGRSKNARNSVLTANVTDNLIATRISLGLC
jgi:hypothetical protein